MLVLLDLDGTLMDPAVGITRCLAHALTSLGRPVPDDAALRALIGPPLQDAFAAMGMSAAQVDDAVSLYRERFATVGMYENVVYEGILELLSGLVGAGATCALATSKAEQFAQRIVEHFGLAPYLALVGGASMDGARRHKQDVIGHVLRQVVVPSRAFMVGDRAVDVHGAREHGLRAVGVTWGFAALGELEAAAPDALVRTPAELLQVLLTG